jgi:hypothetical protein
MITVTKCRVSVQWSHDPDGYPLRPTRFQTYYRVVVDGKIVDSFLTKRRADESAKKLAAAESR